MFAAGRQAEVTAPLKHAFCQDAIWFLFLLVSGLLKMRRKGLRGALGGSLELHLGRKWGCRTMCRQRLLPERETFSQHSSVSSSTTSIPKSFLSYSGVLDWVSDLCLREMHEGKSSHREEWKTQPQPQQPAPETRKGKRWRFSTGSEDIINADCDDSGKIWTVERWEHRPETLQSSVWQLADSKEH